MSRIPQLGRRDVWGLLSNERGRPLTALSWTFAAFNALDDADVHEVLLWMKRQSGKSQWCAAAGASELLGVPGSYTVFVAAAEHQAEAVYARKLRRPLERLARELGIAGEMRFTANTIEVPSLGSVIEVLPSNAATVPGRSVSLLIIDEARDIADGVYATLAPSVIGAGGKLVVASTAGRPAGFFYQLVSAPSAHTHLVHPEVNENPEASRGVLTFLQRRLSALFPAAARRELDNEFAGDGDEFLPRNLVDAAIDDALGEVASSTRPAFVFEDLGRKRDLTSRVVVVVEPPRRPEAGDHLVVASVRVWDPKQSPTGEVDFAEVRADLAQLPRRFPNLKRVLIDEGAEAGSVLPWARSQPSLALRVEGFTATADSNMRLWGALSARLHARTLSLPPHERLLAELRSLRQESFSFGSKWRVVDATRKLHRDVSVALAGAVMAAGEARTCTSPLCADPECTGVAPLQLLFSAESRAWEKTHPPAAVVRAREEAERAVGPEPEDAADGGPSLSEQVQDLARAGLSAFVRRRLVRQQVRDRRIALYLQEKSEREAEAQAARERAAHVKQLADAVKRGPGWFPGDSGL